MPNPCQIEDGYTRIANELLEAWYRSDMLDAKAKMLDWTARESYGRAGEKFTHPVGIRELARILWINHGTLSRTIKLLLKKSFIIKGKNGGYGIQKNYRKWKDGVSKATCGRKSYPHYQQGYPQNGNGPSQGGAKTHRYPQSYPQQERARKGSNSGQSSTRNGKNIKNRRKSYPQGGGAKTQHFEPFSRRGKISERKLQRNRTSFQNNSKRQKRQDKPIHVKHLVRGFKERVALKGRSL